MVGWMNGRMDVGFLAHQDVVVVPGSSNTAHRSVIGSKHPSNPTITTQTNFVFILKLLLFLFCVNIFSNCKNLPAQYLYPQNHQPDPNPNNNH